MSRVLVVDDERPILRALDANLRARGYEVDLAESGEAALSCAAAATPGGATAGTTPAGSGAGSGG